MAVATGLFLLALCCFCWGLQVGERQTKMNTRDRLQRLLTAAKEATAAWDGHCSNRIVRAMRALDAECQVADREMAHRREIDAVVHQEELAKCLESL
jgi:hypothetical protein